MMVFLIMGNTICLRKSIKIISMSAYAPPTMKNPAFIFCMVSPIHHAKPIPRKKKTIRPKNATASATKPAEAALVAFSVALTTVSL